jgi:hypothetical protein
MDPDQPAQSDQDPCCSLSVSLLVIGFVSEQHGSDPIRLRGCASWSGSLLVANPLCWFCHGMAQLHIYYYLVKTKQELFIVCRSFYILKKKKKKHKQKTKKPQKTTNRSDLASLHRCAGRSSAIYLWQRFYNTIPTGLS